MTKTDTTLAQALMITDQQAQYDAACKRLLAEKSILARILKACIPEFKEVDPEEIARKYIESTPQISLVPVLPDQEGALIKGELTEDRTLHEGTIFYDIRFRVLVPGSKEPTSILINLEAQNDFWPGYSLIKRAIYYGSRMISAQYGREFIHSHYDGIKKVYSIWIFPNPSQDFKNSLTEFYIDQRHLGGHKVPYLPESDLIHVIFIGLGNPEKAQEASIWRMLGILLSNEISKEKKQIVLENEYKLELVHNLEKEVIEVSNLGQGVFAQGLAQGRSEGLNEGRVDMLFKIMKKLNLSIDQALQFGEIPQEEQARYRTLLQDMTQKTSL